MVKYRAKNDTVYNFRFYRKGEELEAVALDDNDNFERADGSKAKAAPATQTGGNFEDSAVRVRAKELKIANWHTKGIDKLLAEIAEAEANAAKPNGDPAKLEAVTDSANNPNGSEPNGDSKPDGEKTDN